MSDLRNSLAQLTPGQRERLDQRLRERRQAGTGVPAGERTAVPGLSLGQQRIWRLSRLMGNSSAYNIASSHQLHGPVEVEAMRAALEAVVRRNEALRMIFPRDDGPPIVLAPGRFELGVEDLTADPAPPARVAAWVEHPLDIFAGPLFTARLWQLGPDHHILSLLAHHLVCDGWSMSIIEAQLSRAYRGRLAELDRAPIDFSDYVEWERSREESLRSRLAYWRSALAGVSAIRLPGGRGDESGEVSIELSEAATAGINGLARIERSTPFAVLLAIFAATIHRSTAQQDMVVCAPVAGRPDPAFEQVVGYFNELVPIRGDLSGNPDLSTLIERYRAAVFGAIEHSVPFQWIAGLPEMNATPLARALFALNDVPATDLNFDGVSVQPMHVAGNTSDFELGWFMISDGPRYRATIRYRALSADVIERLAADFTTFADTLVRAPDTRLSDLPDRSPSSVPADTLRILSRPRSLLESRLQRVWERVFGRSVGVDDDFFEIGGHSLLAAELIAEIQSEIPGRPMSLGTIVAAPTIAQFAKLMEHDGWDGTWTALVPLKPSGDRPPLFFVHAHGGNVVGYSALARSLSAEQPLYGLQAPPLPAGSRFRLEDLARMYISEIRTVQPAGPYVVGGWCLGADIAFEVARQLREAGSEVALLLMFDSVRFERRVSDTSSARVRRFAYRIAGRLVLEWFNLAAVEGRPKSRYIAGRVRQIARRIGVTLEHLTTGPDGQLPLGLPHSHAYRQDKIVRLHDKSYEPYQPQRYAGRVAMFRARQKPFGLLSDSSVAWSRLIDGPVEVYEVPGPRGPGLFSSPRVEREVPIIEGAIRAALDHHEAGSV